MPYYRCPACGSLSHSVAAYSTAGVCAVCSASLPDDARVEVLPEKRFGVNRSMAASGTAAARARQAVTNLPLSEHGRGRLSLLVTELVTNAIRHAGLVASDRIDLEVSNDNGRVWVAVRDGGPGFDPDEGHSGAPDQTRFGLSIVDALCEEWGVDRGPEGCTVWCTLELEGIGV